MQNIFENNLINWVNKGNKKSLFYIKDTFIGLNGRWDYIVIDDMFEKIPEIFTKNNPYQKFFKMIKQHLKINGHLIIAVNNKNVSEYFNSTKIKNIFSHERMNKMLVASGFRKINTYYAYPSYKNIVSVYSDDYLPNSEELSKNMYIFNEDEMIKANDYPDYIKKLKSNFIDYTFSYIYDIQLINNKNKPHKIYTKYSIERDNKYKIKTEILKKSNGEIVVRKYPFTEKTWEHIKNIKMWKNILGHRYSSVGILMNQCELKDDYIEFEYIDGKSLETILDEYLKDDKIYEFEQLVKEYINVIKDKITGPGKFIKTDEFISIFGDVELNKEYTTSVINNIDLTLQNIIIKNEKWNIIDYEWVFRIMIPVDFILYRSLFLYAHNRKSKKLHDKLIYEILGITKEEELIFQEMEHNLQLYILGNEKTLDMMYLDYKSGLYE